LSCPASLANFLLAVWLFGWLAGWPVAIVCGIIACDYAARSAVQFISWEQQTSEQRPPQQPPIFTLVGSWRGGGIGKLTTRSKHPAIAPTKLSCVVPQ